ncbi:hypothetical protein [Pectobacterium araliae]
MIGKLLENKHSRCQLAIIDDVGISALYKYFPATTV